MYIQVLTCGAPRGRKDMARRHVKSSAPLIREVQVKAPVRHHLTPVHMAVVRTRLSKDADRRQPWAQLLGL